MAGNSDDDSTKSEEPSEKKIRDAKKKGDVPVSKEIGHLFIYGSILSFITLILPAYSVNLISTLGSVFEAGPQMAIHASTNGIGDLLSSISAMINEVLMFVGVTLGVMFVAAAVSGLLQGPFVVAGERIRPKGSKLSPLKGIKKIFGADNLVEFLKSSVKLMVMGGVSLWLVYRLMDNILPGSGVLPQMLPQLLQSQAATILAWVCGLMVPVVIADTMWKRYSFTKKQRMSMKELKDEHKESEGDPLIRGKRDQIRRERARQRLTTSVPTATMILTNPTHYSVALRYDRGRDMAPVCVAKGSDVMAHRIRKIAHENEIPVIESRALARALFATVEVDQTIPEAHWPAVAELVGFITDMKANIKRKLPEGSSLRED